jgi:hypothetical protein
MASIVIGSLYMKAVPLDDQTASLLTIDIEKVTQPKPKIR